MDDPSIAARLGRTALDEHAFGAPPVLTYRVDAASEPKRTPRAPSARRPAPEAERGPGMGAALGVLVVTAAGAVAGWWISPRLIGEPDTWVLAGSGVGLIASWLGLRWAHRKS